MDAPASVWLVAAAALATLLIVPAVAWTVWLRCPRPRSLPLLVVALVTTLPLVTAFTGALGVLFLVQPLDPTEQVDPCQKARYLAETISETMNLTACSMIVALVTSGGVIAWSRWRRRR